MVVYRMNETAEFRAHVHEYVLLDDRLIGLSYFVCRVCEQAVPIALVRAFAPECIVAEGKDV